MLMEALTLANRTGFINHFVIEGEAMAQQLRQLIQLNTLPELEQHRAQRILRDINQHHRHKFAHFDESFVERLLNHPEVPELIRTSPLTQREWQVLGLSIPVTATSRSPANWMSRPPRLKRIFAIYIRNWASRTARMPFSMPSGCSK